MKKSFSWRILTSFGLFLSFMILLVSGVILYVYPAGGGAGIISEFFGLTKPAWLNQHIIFGLVFTLFSLYHLFYINWTPFLSYLKKKKNEGWQRPAELVTTIVLTTFVAIGTYTHLQPFPAILGTGRAIAGSLEQKSDETPVTNENATAYVERSNRHGDDQEHYDERHASARLASRWQEPQETGSPSFNSGAGNNDTPSTNNGAPDDELHRTTRRSCASCH
ncbi:MAG: DUF4405 domain-containing protein [Chlorobiaceae bacterium]|nr:DUF4405 domain-containing protein [Chlorobiaceae bacterium]